MKYYVVYLMGKNAVIFTFLLILLGFQGISQGLVDGFFTGSQRYSVVIGGGYENNPTYLAGKNKLDLRKSFENLNAFVAYGISDRLDVNLAAAYVKSENEQGFQDARILLKYGLKEFEMRNMNVSLQIASGLSFPLSQYQTEGLNAIGQRATTIPTRLLLHLKRDSGFFATALAGYDYKFDPVPDAITGTLKIGIARRSYYLDAFIDIQNSIDGRDYRGFPAPDNFRELEVDFLRGGVTVFRPITQQLGIFVNGAYTFDGRNVGIGPAINAGIVFKPSL